jgi:hypothetical protein
MLAERKTRPLPKILQAEAALKDGPVLELGEGSAGVINHTFRFTLNVLAKGTKDSLIAGYRRSHVV